MAQVIKRFRAAAGRGGDDGARGSLDRAVERARRGGYRLAAKPVRGAYMVGERQRAAHAVQHALELLLCVAMRWVAHDRDADREGDRRRRGGGRSGAAPAAGPGATLDALRRHAPPLAKVVGAQEFAA